jgi:hypothetical protein
MRSTDWRLVEAVVSVFAIPVVFVGIMFVWIQVNRFRGIREVSWYVRQHQSLVARHLQNPKVHSFSLTHEPGFSHTLLISFDVDDKATYELLESELDDIWEMRFPPMWRTTIRSDEKLPKSWGYAFLGMSKVFDIVYPALIAAFVSVAQAAFFIYRAWRRRRASAPRSCS